MFSKPFNSIQSVPSSGKIMNRPSGNFMQGNQSSFNKPFAAQNPNKMRKPVNFMNPFGANQQAQFQGRSVSPMNNLNKPFAQGIKSQSMPNKPFSMLQPTGKMNRVPKGSQGMTSSFNSGIRQTMQPKLTGFAKGFQSNTQQSMNSAKPYQTTMQNQQTGFAKPFQSNVTQASTGFNKPFSSVPQTSTNLAGKRFPNNQQKMFNQAPDNMQRNKFGMKPRHNNSEQGFMKSTPFNNQNPRDDEVVMQVNRQNLSNFNPRNQFSKTADSYPQHSQRGSRNINDQSMSLCESAGDPNNSFFSSRTAGRKLINMLENQTNHTSVPNDNQMERKNFPDRFSQTKMAKTFRKSPNQRDNEILESSKNDLMGSRLRGGFRGRRGKTDTRRPMNFGQRSPMKKEPIQEAAEIDESSGTMNFYSKKEFQKKGKTGDGSKQHAKADVNQKWVNDKFQEELDDESKMTRNGMKPNRKYNFRKTTKHINYNEEDEDEMRPEDYESQATEYVPESEEEDESEDEALNTDQLRRQNAGKDMRAYLNNLRSKSAQELQTNKNEDTSKPLRIQKPIKEMQNPLIVVKPKKTNKELRAEREDMKENEASEEEQEENEKKRATSADIEQLEKRTSAHRPKINKNFASRIVKATKSTVGVTKVEKRAAEDYDKLKNQVVAESKVVDKDTLDDANRLELKKKLVANLRKKVPIEQLVRKQSLPSQDEYFMKIKVELENEIQPYLNIGECLSFDPERKTGESLETLRAIKAYERSAADRKLNEPKRVRPLHILKEVLTYLTENILDLDKVKEKVLRDCYKITTKKNFNEIYPYIEDRLRSIKQDMGIQTETKTPKDCIEILEQIARFYIMSINEGRDKEVKAFDSVSNIQGLTDTLTSLRKAYEECRKCAIKAIHKMKDYPELCFEYVNKFPNLYYISPNEAEFLAYDLLIQLESDKGLKIQQKLESFPIEIIESEEIKFIMKVISAFRKNNYVEFFKLLKQANYLTACVMSYLFKKIRIVALETMEKYLKQGISFSVSEFKNMLYFESPEECYEFLQKYGLDELESDSMIDDIHEVRFLIKRIRSLSTDEFKAFKALQSWQNTTIIEAKREKINFMNLGQKEEKIYYNNHQVSRRFIIQGDWKEPQETYVQNVVKSIYKMITGKNLIYSGRQKTKADEKILEEKKSQEEIEREEEEEEEEEGEVEEEEEEEKEIVEVKPITLIPKVPSKIERQISTEKPIGETIAPKQQQFVPPINQHLPSAITLQKEPSKAPSTSTEGKLHLVEPHPITIPKKEPISSSKPQITSQKPLQLTATETKITKIKKLKSEYYRLMFIFYRWKALVIAKKEFLREKKEKQKEFDYLRKCLMKPRKEYGLSRTRSDIYNYPTFEEEELPFKIFPLLAKTLSDKCPFDTEVTFKALILTQVQNSTDITFINLLLTYLTDGVRDFYSIDADLLPELFIHHDIKFSVNNINKKLKLSYLLYSEVTKCPEKNNDKDNESDSEDIDHFYTIPKSDVLSSNIIFFVLSKDLSFDKQRFNPLLNILKTKKFKNKSLHLIFFQPYEVSFKKGNIIHYKKYHKADIIEVFKLKPYIEAEKVTLSCINVPYYESFYQDDNNDGNFIFPKIEQKFDTKLRGTILAVLERLEIMPQPKLYTFDELGVFMASQIKISENSFIDNSKAENPLKLGIFYTEMNKKSMESYFYIKTFINYTAQYLIDNLDDWCEKIDWIPQELYPELDFTRLLQVRETKEDLKLMLQMLFKLDDFHYRYMKRLDRNIKHGNTYDVVYYGIKHKLHKIFSIDTRDLELESIFTVLNEHFSFDSVIGITGAWALLFEKLYQIYIEFLMQNDIIFFILDANLRITYDIEAMTDEVEIEIANYNAWIQTINFLDYEDPVHYYCLDPDFDKPKPQRNIMEYEVIFQKQIQENQKKAQDLKIMEEEEISPSELKENEKIDKKADQLLGKRNFSSLIYDQDFEFESFILKKYLINSIIKFKILTLLRKFFKYNT